MLWHPIRDQLCVQAITTAPGAVLSLQIYTFIFICYPKWGGFSVLFPFPNALNLYYEHHTQICYPHIP